MLIMLLINLYIFSLASHLYAELSQINLNLPARICLPLHSSSPHHIVRIPPSEAVVLNSKSKVPYIVYVEVLECDHTYLSSLPSKQLESFVKGFGLYVDNMYMYMYIIILYMYMYVYMYM